MPPASFDLPAAFVDTPDSLAEALPEMYAAATLSIDAEFSLTGTHYCVLALLQVASGHRVWLVDPLALPNLIRPLLLALAETPWIAHDYSGDGVVFKRLYDVVPSSVMDTMMLAKALGYLQPGLKAMAKAKLGIDIPKHEQDSNWMLRPLRESQLKYAARDAALLLPLLRELAAEAEARGPKEPDLKERLSRLPEDVSHLLGRLRGYATPGDPPLVHKILSMELGQEVAERARKLVDLRHVWGNEGDVAAVMELGNRWIISQAQRPPKSMEALAKTIRNQRFLKKRLDALWGAFA
jgi:ribonuclease D